MPNSLRRPLKHGLLRRKDDYVEILRKVPNMRWTSYIPLIIWLEFALLHVGTVYVNFAALLLAWIATYLIDRRQR
jgi:hypothetical protein